MTESMTQLLIDTMQEAICDVIGDMVHDIMSLKSFSQGEAFVIALQILGKGITPKSDEYYNYIDGCKTMWEV